MKYITVTTGRGINGAVGYRAEVHPDGDVLVWDDIAGHYTRCHSLTPAQQAYCRAHAQEAE